MQYALLIYAKPGATEALGDDEAEAVHREYLELKELPGMLGGAALHPVETATTVRGSSRAGPQVKPRRAAPIPAPRGHQPAGRC